MKTALHFLLEWVDEEAWKIHVLNKVMTKDDIDLSQLLGEVLHLIKSKEKLDIVSNIRAEEIDEKKLILDGINAPKNINALAGDVQFSLGRNLNVFYGENGSGKSSYVRMFRKLADNYFTSRKNLTITPNVYQKEHMTETMLQTVEITYTVGDEKKNEVVDINQRHSTLCKINVFDSESVTPLINSDLTFSILPKGFDIFRIISNLLDSFRSELSEYMVTKKCKQDNIFSDTSYDFVRNELEKILNEITDPKDIKDYLNGNYPRSESYEETIQEIDLQIKDLETSNPKDKITILSAQKTKLTSIKESIHNMSKILNRENIQKVNKLIQDYEQKIIEERKFNESFKKNVSFLEVVNNEWLVFVESGWNYFKSINKVKLEVGEPCIFCSNPLNSTRVSIIDSHMLHVANSSTEAIDSIEKELLRHDISNTVIALSNEEVAFFESEKFLEKIKSTIQMINLNIELFSSLLNEKKVINESVMLDVSDVVHEISKEIEVLSYRIEEHMKTNEQIIEIITLRKALKETLQKNEKLHTSMDSLKEWFQIEETIEEYRKAKRKFFTTTLTQKQAEAFKEIVQDEYFETFKHFSDELKVSNVNLKLTPQKGKTIRNKFVSSVKYKVAEIMSEGEQKAIAMVEFATDLTMRKNFNTLLLDDPVTSLDYKRSEMIAKLIYQLSLDRQVVVFTHNIMFYYYLYQANSKIKNKENKFFKIDEFDKLNKGIVSESFSGRLDNLSAVMRKLSDQEQRINSKVCIGDELEEALKRAYSDIRTWCELIVEEGFFKSVVRRYEPNIMFTKVKDIKGGFVDELNSVTELFNRSCRWMTGHSQPIETQHIRATKEAFSADMAYIHQLFEQYK